MFWHWRHNNMRKMQKEKCSRCLNIDLAFSLPHKHALRCQCLCGLMSFTQCRSSSQAMAGDEQRCFLLSKTCKVKGYQTNSLKQIQSWHGDSATLVPRTLPPAEHFNNAISEEHCQILVFPNTRPQLRQPPSLRPWSASPSHYSAGIDDFVSWASRLRLDG